MGGALIKGWAKTGKHSLTITARTEQTLSRFRNDFPNIKTSLDNVKAVKGADVIVLAVKPWLIEEVIMQIRDSINFDEQIMVIIYELTLTNKYRSEQ